MTKLTDAELIAVKEAFRDATLLREAFPVAFAKMGLAMTPLTLMVAAVQEFHEVSAQHGDLPATGEAFAKQCGDMANAVGKVQFTLAELIAAAESSAPSFNEVPSGAFVVPGPSEPQ